MLAVAADGSVATDPSGTPYNAVVNKSKADDTLDADQVREVQEEATGSAPVRVTVGGDIGTYLDPHADPA